MLRLLFYNSVYNDCISTDLILYETRRLRKPSTSDVISKKKAPMASKGDKNRRAQGGVLLWDTKRNEYKKVGRVAFTHKGRPVYPARNFLPPGGYVGAPFPHPTTGEPISPPNTANIERIVRDSTDGVLY